MEKCGIEIRRCVADDFSLEPKWCQNERDGYGNTLYRYFNWAMIPTKKDTVPHYVFRNMLPTSFRENGGIIRFGEDPLKPHTGLFHKGYVAQGDTKMDELYGRLALDKETYGMKSYDPLCVCTYDEDGGIWKEGDILDVKVEWWPISEYCHVGSPQEAAPYSHHYAIFTGTYNGEQVKFLGCDDRTFSNNFEGQQAALVQNVTYSWGYYCGIRKDGRKESSFCKVIGKNGHGMAYYWLEGEEPVITDEVWMEADWQRVPYSLEGDNSATFTNMTWRFADKVLHGRGQWGSKGFMNRPRVEVPGLSQVHGDWYMGDEFYEHDYFQGYTENIGATVEGMTKMGFTVSK